MKKLAIGCGVVIVVCAVAFWAGAYFFMSKARSYVGQLTEFTKITELDKNVANRAPFAPPASGELSDDQMKRFAAVQDSMHAKLGPRVDELKDKEDQVLKLQQGEHRKATAAENFTTITDLMKFVLEAKNAQVDALNQQHLSLDEYYWIRGRVYAAAGVSAMEISMRNMQDSMKQGEMMKPLGAAAGASSDHDKKLVEPYLPKMKDWAVVAFFGM